MVGSLDRPLIPSAVAAASTTSALSIRVSASLSDDSASHRVAGAAPCAAAGEAIPAAMAMQPTIARRDRDITTGFWLTGAHSAQRPDARARHGPYWIEE